MVRPNRRVHNIYCNTEYITIPARILCVRVRLAEFNMNALQHHDGFAIMLDRLL